MGRLLPIACWALIIAACAGKPSYTDLDRDPALKLRIAGAVELLHLGGDNELTLDGPVDAWDGFIFGVHVAPSEVFEFYRRELYSLGWAEDPLRLVQLSTETQAKSWCSASSNFRVGIENQATAFQPNFYRGETFKTVYEARITARGPGGSCPARLDR